MRGFGVQVVHVDQTPREHGVERDAPDPRRRGLRQVGHALAATIPWMPSIHEPARETPVSGEFDVVVLGGGPAGIAAAAAAARSGSTTLLIERYGFLGGMGTAAGVTNFCGLHANVHGDVRQVVHGIADDLLARLTRLGGLNEPWDMTFTPRIGAVPEPGSLALLAGLGVTGSIFAVRRLCRRKT